MKKYLKMVKCSDEESDDDFLKDLKRTVKNWVLPLMRKSIYGGLRSLGQTEEVKKLNEKYQVLSNMENLQVPKVDSVIWRNISDKGKAVDAGIQKAVAKF